jgi:hypothetical protein
LYSRKTASAERCAADSSARGIATAWQTGRASLKRSAKIRFKAGKRGIEQFPTRYYDDIDSRPDRQACCLPEDLSYQPFSSISPHRVAELAGGHDPESRRSRFIGRDQHCKVASLGPQRQIENALEFTATPDPAGL